MIASYADRACATSASIDRATRSRDAFARPRAGVAKCRASVSERSWMLARAPTRASSRPRRAFLSTPRARDAREKRARARVRGASRARDDGRESRAARRARAVGRRRDVRRGRDAARRDGGVRERRTRGRGATTGRTSASRMDGADAASTRRDVVATKDRARRSSARDSAEELGEGEGERERAEDVAAKFDPLELTRTRVDGDDRDGTNGKRRVKRKPSNELHPTVVEALKSSNETVRNAAKFMIEQGLDEETEKKFAYLKSLPALMPKPSSEATTRLTAREEPKGPKALSKAFGFAIQNQDFEWASAEEIGALFSDDVDYLNVHGDYFKGKEEVVLSLNESVRRMSTRMRGASTRGDGRTLKYMKYTVDGPNYKGRAPNEREWSTWHINYTFKILLLTVKIREIYFVDDETDLIRHIARCRV